MCLILFSYKSHPDFPLVVAANRDEFYQRPTRAVHFWPQAPDVLAGKDLQAGGGWMGVTRSGRFAAVTNYRDPNQDEHYPQSRGALVMQYLQENNDTRQYLAAIDKEHSDYAGFNLLLGTYEALFYYSNQQRVIQKLEAGVHGLSNGHLDEAWPKVVDGKAQLRAAIDRGADHEEIFALLADRSLAADNTLPSTGIDVTMEKALSAKFIQLSGYGTRSSTVITIDRHQQLSFSERTFNDQGQPVNTLAFQYKLPN